MISTDLPHTVIRPHQLPTPDWSGPNGDKIRLSSRYQYTVWNIHYRGCYIQHLSEPQSERKPVQCWFTSISINQSINQYQCDCCSYIFQSIFLLRSPSLWHEWGAAPTCLSVVTCQGDKEGKLVFSVLVSIFLTFDTDTDRIDQGFYNLCL